MVGTTNTGFFYGDGKEDFVVAESMTEALVLAQREQKLKLTSSRLNDRILTR